MGRVRDAKRHEEVLDLLSGIHADAVGHTLDANVGRVLEESDGRPPLEDGLEKGDLIGVWLKHAVGESAFLFLQETLI